MILRLNRMALENRWRHVPPELRPPIVEQYRKVFRRPADPPGLQVVPR